jgi:RHS repeat-associated protein
MKKICLRLVILILYKFIPKQFSTRSIAAVRQRLHNRIDFILDGALNRQDQMVSGRSSFKTMTRHLLRRIDVSFESQRVRRYVFTYETGQFLKSRLKQIEVHGEQALPECIISDNAFLLPSCASNSDFFYEHHFEYEAEPEAFGDVERWDVLGPAGTEADGLTKSFDSSVSVSVYTGVGALFKRFSVGFEDEVNWGKRKENVGFYDVNGDGLPDILFQRDPSIAPDALLNQNSASASCSTNADDSNCRFTINTPSGDLLADKNFLIEHDEFQQLGEDFHIGYSVGAQGYVGAANAGASYNLNFSNSRAFMTDVDGNGLLDQMGKDHVLLSERCVMNALPGLCFRLTSYSVNQDTEIDEDLAEYIDEQLNERLFNGDVLRQWVAPYAGEIEILAEAQKLYADTDLVDGVNIELFHYHPPTDDSFGSDDHGTLTRLGFQLVGGQDEVRYTLYNNTRGDPEFPTLPVEAGDWIVLKVSNNVDIPFDSANTPLDLVDSLLDISYTKACRFDLLQNEESCNEVTEPNAKEPNGSGVYAFNSVNDFRLSGGNPPAFIAPISGHIQLFNTWQKFTSADNFRVCVQRIRQLDLEENAISNIGLGTPCGSVDSTYFEPLYIDNTIDDLFSASSTGSLNQMVNFEVQAGDAIVLRVESDFSIDPLDLRWTASLQYIDICPLAPNECLVLDGTNDQDFAFGPKKFTAYYPDFSLLNEVGPLSTVQIPVTTQVKVADSLSFQDLSGFGFPPRAILAIRSFDRLIYKEEVFAGSSGVNLEFNVTAGESLSFEIFNPHPEDYQVNWNPLVAYETFGSSEVFSPPVHQFGFGTNRPFRSDTDKKETHQGLFAGGFHGWYYGVWNQKVPFIASNLSKLFTLHLGFLNSSIMEQILNDTIDPEDPAALGAEFLLLNRMVMVPNQSGSLFSSNAQAWEGLDETIFISATQMHGARALLRGSAELQTPEGTETVDIDLTQHNKLLTGAYRSSLTESTGGGFPVGPLSLNISTGDTNTRNDFADMDGDGILDQIRVHQPWLKGRLDSDDRSGGAPLAGASGALSSTIITNYGVGIGVKTNKNKINSAGRNTAMDVSQPSAGGGGQFRLGNTFDASAGVGAGIARNRMTADIMDINGDGLPDLVLRDSSVCQSEDRVLRRRCGEVVVRYNLGGWFGPEEVLEAHNWFESNNTALGTIESDNIVDRFGQATNLLPSLLPESLDRVAQNSSNSLKHDTTITRSFNVGFTSPVAGIGIHYSFNSSVSHTVTNLLDLNGDGLLDLVIKKHDRPMFVQYNLGNRFAPPKKIENTFNSWLFDEGQGQVNLLATEGAIIPLFEGLIPRPGVMELLPHDISQAPGHLPILTLSGPDTLSGTSSFTNATLSGGSHSGGYATIPAGPFIINPGYSRGTDYDNYEMTLADIDGDGVADHVLRKNLHAFGRPNGGDFFVKRNKVTGKSNLLTKITRPLGATIDISYKRTANTVDLPQSRYVLDKVIVNDNLDISGPSFGDNFASPNLETSYEFIGGKYDRNEKEFFGFRKVISHFADGSKAEETFNNTDYEKKGLLEKAETFGISLNPTLNGERLSLVTYQYETRVDFLADENNSAACLKRLHFLQKPRVGRSTSCDVTFTAMIGMDSFTYEGSDFKEQHDQQNIEDYDTFGNLLRSEDQGDHELGSSDNVFATVTYENRVNTWILGLPTLITVRAGSHFGPILRQRFGVYDDSGNLSKLSTKIQNAGVVPPSEFDPDSTTGSFTYDIYGNLKTVTSPPTDSFTPQANLLADQVTCAVLPAESQTVTYTYDTVTQQYATNVVDGFGLQANSTYDLKYGLVTKVLDTNNNSMTKEYDGFGRLTKIFGPYDTDNTKPAILMEYKPQDHIAITKHRIAKPDGYDVSEFGAQLPDQTAAKFLTTVTIVDGLDRPIEVKKSAAVNGVAAMIVSPPVQYDIMGRITKTYQPFVDFTQSLDAAAPQSNNPTRVTYDVRNRVTQVFYPDHTSALPVFDSKDYLIATDSTGAKQFLTIFKDALQNQAPSNNRIRKSFTDAEGRTTEVVEPNNAKTKYRYNSLSELTDVFDANNNRTFMEYDLRGLRKVMSNPDTGKLISTYDKMGNLVSYTEPNHRVNNAGPIKYGYRKGRLECIDYPVKENVKFTFGANTSIIPNAKGRLLTQEDETGVQAFSYGKMGEALSFSREFDPQMLADGTAQGTNNVVSKQRFVTAYDSFGRVLSMTYPDGERIRYFYDLGGKLTKVQGKGRFISTNTNTVVTRDYVSELRYDHFGNRTHAKFQNGTVTNWTYEPKRVRLQTLQTTAPLLSGGTTTSTPLQDLTYQYDATGNPTQLTSNLPNTPFDNDGRLPGKGSWGFSYDNNDRLTNVFGCLSLAPNKSVTYKEAFSYDNIHNITNKFREQRTSSSGNCQFGVGLQGKDSIDFGYTYNPVQTGGDLNNRGPHQPQQIGNETFAYDPSGNLLSQGTNNRSKQFIWDDANRMVQATGSNATSQTSLLKNYYGADGLRARKFSGTLGETLFVSQFFDIRTIRFELSQLASGQNPRAFSVANKHIFAGGWRIATEITSYNASVRGNAPETDNGSSAGTALFFHQDHLGSTGLLTLGFPTLSNVAQLFERTEYYADGGTWIERGANTSLNGYKFSGKFFDPETGLYDFGARFYDPKTSLWLGNDAVLREGGNTPLQLSSYAYANHSPFKFIDPDGNKPIISANSADDRTNDDVSKYGNGEALVSLYLAHGWLEFAPLDYADVAEVLMFVGIQNILGSELGTAASLDGPGYGTKFTGERVGSNGKNTNKGTGVLEQSPIKATDIIPEPNTGGQNKPQGSLLQKPPAEAALSNSLRTKMPPNGTAVKAGSDGQSGGGINGSNQVSPKLSGREQFDSAVAQQNVRVSPTGTSKAKKTTIELVLGVMAEDPLGPNSFSSFATEGKIKNFISLGEGQYGFRNNGLTYRVQIIQENGTYYVNILQVTKW